MTKTLRLSLAAGALITTILLVTRGLAENPVPYQGQNTGRYQMFFSPFARADSFLVDTQTGVIRQLALAENGNRVFQIVKTEKPPAPGTSPGRFRIFFGSHARADAFLLDTASGDVWELTQDPDTETTFFRPRTVER
jgi:hypothetical protein